MKREKRREKREKREEWQGRKISEGTLNEIL
jgi:hypothetical protein